MRANPPLHRQIPKELLKNKDEADFYQGFLFDMFLLWQKVGGGADFVEEALQGLYEFDDIKQIDIKRELRREISVQSNDYTTYTSETVICPSAITVTLNPEPENEELVQVKITSGNVTIDAGAKKIDGQESIIFIANRFQGQPMIDVFYSVVTDEWYIV